MYFSHFGKFGSTSLAKFKVSFTNFGWGWHNNFFFISYLYHLFLFLHCLVLFLLTKIVILSYYSSTSRQDLSLSDVHYISLRFLLQLFTFSCFSLFSFSLIISNSEGSGFFCSFFSHDISPHKQLFAFLEQPTSTKTTTTTTTTKTTKSLQ